MWSESQIESRAPILDCCVGVANQSAMQYGKPLMIDDERNGGCEVQRGWIVDNVNKGG